MSLLTSDEKKIVTLWRAVLKNFRTAHTPQEIDWFYESALGIERDSKSIVIEKYCIHIRGKFEVYKQLRILNEDHSDIDLFEKEIQVRKDVIHLVDKLLEASVEI